MAKSVMVYSVAKDKKVVCINPIVDKDGNHYAIHGKDKDGGKLYGFLKGEDAIAYVKSGAAKKGKWK